MSGNQSLQVLRITYLKTVSPHLVGRATPDAAGKARPTVNHLTVMNYVKLNNRAFSPQSLVSYPSEQQPNIISQPFGALRKGSAQPHPALGVDQKSPDAVIHVVAGCGRLFLIGHIKCLGGLRRGFCVTIQSNE